VEEVVVWEWKSHKLETDLPNILIDDEAVEGNTGTTGTQTKFGAPDGNVRRSTRKTKLPLHIRDYELFYDAIAIDEGNFVHYAMIVESKPIEFEQVVTNEK